MMQSAGSSAHRKRTKSTMENKQCPSPAVERDWAALPRDILFSIFLKLGPRETMLGAEFACTAWRRVAVEEPSLWRSIGFHSIDEVIQRWVNAHTETAMAFVALERSSGQCEAFRGYLDDEELADLVQRYVPSHNVHEKLYFLCF
ncbi:hypothetical protein QOZ80_8BG0648250 [Eleusine coracana subsp. coracana]|nr:hypothetical protein QOZ80_8BG0648250 [Eleusine coracana subsp. coracana]